MLSFLPADREHLPENGGLSSAALPAGEEAGAALSPLVPASTSDFEARLALIPTLMPHSAVLTDAQGHIEWVNAAFTRISGYTLDEVRGKKPGAILQGADTDADAVARIRAALHNRVGFEGEIYNYDRAGRGYWLSLSITPLFDDASGTLRGFASVQTDITERKSVEQKLRLLHSAVENANDVLLISEAEPLDSPGPRVVYVNPAFTRMTGYEASEIIGQTPRLLQGADTDAATRDGISARLKAWKPVRAEMLNYRKDGSEFWVELNIRPIADENGWYTHWIAVQRDVTERKQAERRLQESQEKLAQAAQELERRNQELAHARDDALAAVRLKSEILANTSHEVRTPLNGIMGMATLLSQCDLAAPQRQWAQTIHSSADALLAILNDILDFSKIEAGKLTLEAIPFDLRDLLNNMVGLLTPRAHSKGLKLVLCWPDTVDTEADVRDETLLRGDPGRLRQILLNLTENAIKFTPAGGTVTLGANRLPADDTHLPDIGQDDIQHNDTYSRWQLWVRDTGIGIDSAQQERIFESFTQADGSTTRRYGGTGLGLTICRQLVRLMGGSLHVDSILEQGSTFTVDITLPQNSRADTPTRADAPLFSVVRADTEALATSSDLFGPDAPCLDRTALASAARNDPQAARKLLAKFALNAPRAIARCAIALELDDGATLEHWARGLQESCVTIGAARMALLCAELETLGRASAFSQAAPLLDQLEEAWESLRALLPL